MRFEVSDTFCRVARFHMGFTLVILSELALLNLRAEHYLLQYIRPTRRNTLYWFFVGIGMSAPHSWQLNHCIFQSTRGEEGLLTALRGGLGRLN